jgi:hypothetical protein
VSFLFQPGGHFSTAFGPLIFQGRTAGAVCRKQQDGDQRHADERSAAADENNEPIDGARRFGRHISWSI